MINSVQLQQAQRADEQLRLAMQTTNLQNIISNLQSSQSSELAKLYNDLAQASDSTERENINELIIEKENFFDAEIKKINNQIYQNSIKENAIEMEVKRLDTKLAALQKQLEALKEAEGNGIEKITPKFQGLG